MAILVFGAIDTWRYVVKTLNVETTRLCHVLFLYFLYVFMVLLLILCFVFSLFYSYLSQFLFSYVVLSYIFLLEFSFSPFQFVLYIYQADLDDRYQKKLKAKTAASFDF